MYGQGYGLNYYVYKSECLPKPKRNPTKVDEIAYLLDKLVYLYHEELLTFEQIQNKTGINWWTIKNLFKQKGIKTISISKRAEIKREKDYEIINNLFFNKKLSLKKIYNEYGFSPSYSKRVLNERGIEF